MGVYQTSIWLTNVYPDLSESDLKMNQIKNYKQGSISLFVSDLNYDLS